MVQLLPLSSVRAFLFSLTPRVGRANTASGRKRRTFLTRSLGAVCASALAVALPLAGQAQTISGRVFEDVNYGGGAGRNYATANTSATASGYASGAIGRGGVRVELYNVTSGGGGTYLATTNTAANGTYSFTIGNATANTFRVRVVNSGVTSVRTGAVAALRAVSTYAGNDADAVNRVGGQFPAFADEPNGGGTNTLDGFNNTLTDGEATLTLSNQVSASTTTAAVNVDFGFSFDVVVNTRTSGVGSLQQFITNANALSNTAPFTLQQAGQTAGEEVSIFMIPDGVAHPGLLASGSGGPANALSGIAGDVLASISIPNTGSEVLPVITGANTVVDGTTQTANVGNTNTGTLGNAGTAVGTGPDGRAASGDELTLTGTDAPEVELIGPGGASLAGASPNCFRVDAANVEIRGFVIRSFNTAAITSLLGANSAGLIVENNLFGLPTALTPLPTNNQRLARGVSLFGVQTGGTGASIRRNLFGLTRNGAVFINGNDQNSVISATIENNEIQRAGSGNNADPAPTGAAISATGEFSNLTVQQNLIGVANTTGDYNGVGITYTSANAGNNPATSNILNNTFSAIAGYSVLVAGGATESQNKRGTIGRNIITGGDLDGIRVSATNASFVITRNSISGNAGLGINLVGPLDVSPNVTLNDNGDSDAGPNGLLNYPVFTSATIVGGTQLEIAGFAPSNAIIELFRNAAADASGFGEGLTYLGQVQEAVSDLDGTMSGYGPTTNGLAQGTELNANRFRFRIALPAGVAIGDFLSATATLTGTNVTSEFGGRIQVAGSIQGRVFEDVNYGGGLGRDYTTANTSAVASGFTSGAIGRPNAVVERYDAGVFVDTARTNANGIYTFAAVTSGTTYTLRVVNSTVSSTRTGYVSGLLPVQTFNGATDYVGGEAPDLVDAAANTYALPVLLAALGTPLVSTPQSLRTVTASAAITDADFGFNFDLIVSTRDAGQGSLRQFILNANALGNEALLAQSGAVRSAINGATTPLPAARETSIWMIPNGTAVPGIRTGLVNQLNGSGVAVITPATVLPAITSPSTGLDGRSQSFNLSNPNATALRAATTAGTNAVSVAAINGPEVQIVGGALLASGIDATAAATSFRVAGLAIYGFGGSATDFDIRSAATGTIITENVVGTTAASFADPGVGRSLGTHIVLTATAAASSQITNNLVGFGNGAGIRALPVGVTISGNSVVSNGVYAATNQDGIDAQGSAFTITGNLVTGNGAAGVELGSSPGAGTLTSNTISGNGRRGTRTPGVRVGGASSIISLNSITGNYGAGVLVINTATGNRISQNAISANGTITGLPATAATGQLGIDLLSAADDQQTGTAPYVTVNDSGDGDTGANGLLNYPVLATASLGGGLITVTGFARPGTAVEFFIAAPDGSSFGEGGEYLVTRTEGSGDDTDAGTGTYGPVAVNGLLQGTDNTNRFTFTLPYSTLTVAQQTAILTGGLTATGTVSNATSEFSGLIAFVTISGTVFEDPNYGGGAGRDYATANTAAVTSGFATGTIRRPNARVELYDGTGTQQQSTVTDASGAYIFAGVGSGSYTVRVVNNTVTSARPGYVASLTPVQTFVVSNGAADVNRVGGEAPEKVDAPASGAPAPTLIEIVGLNPSGGDNTAFVDLVSITGAPSVLLNPSFETPSLGSGFQYAPGGASWAFSGAGIAGNGSAFGAPAAPGGTQVAFVQTTGSMSQSVILPAGSYTITFQAAQRACCSATNNQQLEVRVNGVPVGTIQPVAGGGYVTFTSSTFTVTAPVATTLASLNTATTIAQSQAVVTVGTSSVAGVDFGYSFDVVCNTLNTGQGSLRQFLANANALTNANLAQAGQTAGRETTIFMIPNGTAVAGLRAGLVNQLTGGTGDARAVITLPSGGAALQSTDANTTIDGSTQTANVGDTNTGTLGSTETTGTDATPIAPLAQPEVEIAGHNSMSILLQLTGANGVVRRVAARGSSNTVYITGTGYLIEGNAIGTSAIAYQWEGNVTVSGNFGIEILGSAVGTVQNNLIGYTGNSGIDIDNGLATAGVTTIQGNQFNQNGYTSAGGDGVSLGDSGGSGPMLIQNNLFTRSNSSAVQFEIQQTAVSTVTNNTMVSCGKGGAGSALSSLEGSAICYLQRNGTRVGTQADVISKNLIVDTQASAIVVGYGQSNVTITQNSIFNSGSIAIDLVFNPNAYVGGPGLGATEYGSGDGVDLNNGAVATPPTPLPNRGMDYSVLTSLDVLAGNMIVSGFSRPGATVELYVPATDPTRFGEGRTFLYSRVEGSVDDTDAGTGAYGPAAINGVPQGQDASAARFTFTVPFSSLPAATQAAILTNGLTSTATLNANTSEFSADVTLRADVYATLTPVASPVGGGATAQFNAVFGNFGPSSANGIVAVVQLPAGLGTVVATNGGVYNNTTGVVSYTGLTALTAGQTLASTISYTQPIAVGAVAGAASISTTTNENGAYANNVQTATILTDLRFDLTTSLNGPATAAAGVLVTYGVITTNNGPTTAANVVQTVTLPTGLSGVFASNGGTYNPGTGVVTFPALSGLASGQRRDNSVSFLAPAASFSLTADVTPLTGDIVPANNTTAVPFATTITGPAGPPANVWVSVTSNAPVAGVAPGAPVTFSVNQGNYGPNTATDVATYLTLAPGLSGAVVNAGGSYNSTTGLVTWPPLPTQATNTAAVTRTVQVNAPASGLLTAVASVVPSSADPVPADNVASTQVTITNANITDVRVVLSGPARAIAGQSLSYVVTTTNAGFNPANDVVPSVDLPTGLSGVVVSGGGTYNPLTGTVTFPATAVLSPGAALANTITFTAPLNDAASLPLAAGVFTTSTELSPANNVSRLSTLLQAYADVEVLITGPAFSTVGSPVTYVVTTTNNGPAVSNGHGLTVQLPSGLAGVALSAGGSYNPMSGVVTFTNVTNQLPGAVGALVRTISFTTPDRAFVTPTASITITGADDPITTNNLALTTTSIATPTVPRANIGVTVTSNVATQTAGLPITFTVTANNTAGPNAASGVVQQLALRPGLTGVTVSNSGTYNATTGIVTWSLPDIAPGTTLPARTVTINAPGTGPLVATAIVAANETDLTTANNRATASVTITPSADVAINVNGRSVTEPGVTVTYSVTTLNNGASPATTVVQTVQLPTGLTGVVVTGSGSYNPMTGVVTFPTITTQPIGSAGVVTNTITFTSPATPYAVVGTVTTATTDPIPGNNSDTQNTIPTINRKPIAFDVVNTLQAPRGETSTQARPLSALLATDPDGTVASFTVLSLPDPATGVLSLGGVPVVVNQVLTPTQATQLAFRPVAGFVGNAFFAYRATDNLGATGNQALVTIPVGLDNASVYTNAPVQGGNDPYQNNDDIATVFDANGGEYATGPVVSDNGTRTVFLAMGSNPLAPGVGLDPVTGRLFVADRTLLVAGSYTALITTIDEFAGETTQLVPYVIGANPLPVTFTRFTATGRNVDAVLAWATASEQNADYFAVERSLDGRTFRQIGRRTAAGTTTTPQEYGFTDAGIGRTAGTVYYRLRQVDFDGTATFTEVQTVVFTGKQLAHVVRLFPNPATSSTTLDLTEVEAGTYAAALYDATGRLVLTATQPGGTRQELDVAALPTGSYVVRVTNAATGFAATVRLVKE